MVIFRIIFNLIRLGIRLLLLPLFILSRNLFLIILLVIIIALYMAFSDAEPPAQVTPGSTTSSAPREQPRSKSGEILIEAVRRREDGNSAFSADLYAQMDEMQRAYYSQVFYWAMTNLPDGQTQAWANGNTNGSFMPTDRFRNNRGDTCRRFREVLKVRATEQSLTGLACSKSPAGSWCKLQPNATPACGLGSDPGFWESIKGMFR